MAVLTDLVHARCVHEMNESVSWRRYKKESVLNNYVVKFLLFKGTNESRFMTKSCFTVIVSRGVEAVVHVFALQYGVQNVRRNRQKIIDAMLISTITSLKCTHFLLSE